MCVIHDDLKEADTLLFFSFGAYNARICYCYDFWWNLKLNGDYDKFGKIS